MATRGAGAILSTTPTLVDAIRARLRGEIDPLPAFEARVIQHADAPVAVVRVYESSDTPHVVLRSGAVFVREPAETRNAADPKRSGGGSRAERAYQATRIRSRQQILELAERGRHANARVLDSPSGVGLGLAIVQAIANAHDATLTAQARTGGGLRIDVAFPLSTETNHPAAGGEHRRVASVAFRSGRSGAVGVEMDDQRRDAPVAPRRWLCSLGLLRWDAMLVSISTSYGLEVRCTCVTA
jgi:hypothetical protein